MQSIQWWYTKTQSDMKYDESIRKADKKDFANR